MTGFVPVPFVAATLALNQAEVVVIFVVGRLIMVKAPKDERKAQRHKGAKFFNKCFFHIDSPAPKAGTGIPS